MPTSVLKVNQLYKDYGKFRAVDGISFEIPKGKVLGLLGPNGAGKTTTIHILLGITLPTSGEIKYFDLNFKLNRQACLQRINFASAYNTLLGRITVKQNLMVFAGLYQVANSNKKIDELLDFFEVKQLANNRYWDLSAGERTRVNLAKCLINDPELILMDEPTASLDPDISDKVLGLIETLKHEKQMSILFTSHDMNEVTRICDDVIFLDHGKIVQQDSPHNLTRKLDRCDLIISFDGSRQDVLKHLPKNLEVSFPFETIASIRTTEKQLPKLLYEM